MRFFEVGYQLVKKNKGGCVRLLYELVMFLYNGCSSNPNPARQRIHVGASTALVADPVRAVPCADELAWDSRSGTFFFKKLAGWRTGRQDFVQLL